MDEEKILHTISDANVEKLRRANEVLEKPPWANRGGVVEGPRRERQQPGTRADGGMARQGGIEALLREIQQHENNLQNALADTRRLIDNFEDEQLRREDEILQLKATLEEEHTRRLSLENHCNELKDTLRKAAAIMVNGGKE